MTTLEQALAKADIPMPKQVKESGITRYGKNYRYWIVPVPGGGVSFGDFSQDKKSFWHPDMDKTKMNETRDADSFIPIIAKPVSAPPKLTAQELALIWDSLTPVDPRHPYLRDKQIQNPLGLKQNGKQLAVPMMGHDGSLTGIQLINEDGRKKFMAGSQLKGSYHLIGEPSESLIICEGYATGASLHQATGCQVAVTFSAANLEAAGEVLKANYPHQRLIIACDNDYHSSKTNVGLETGCRLATMLDARLAIPTLGQTIKQKCDFNDVYGQGGSEAVLQIFKDSGCDFKQSSPVVSPLSGLVKPKEGIMSEVAEKKSEAAKKEFWNEKGIGNIVLPKSVLVHDKEGNQVLSKNGDPKVRIPSSYQEVWMNKAFVHTVKKDGTELSNGNVSIGISKDFKYTIDSSVKNKDTGQWEPVKKEVTGEDLAKFMFAGLRKEREKAQGVEK